MFRLLLCLLLLIPLPVSAGILICLAHSRPCSTPLNNSQDFLPVDLAFGLDLIEADTDSIRLRFINADGYYLYKHRFAFNSDHPQVTIGTPQWPAAEPKTDEYFGDVEVFYGITDLELPIDNPQNRPFTLQVSYQGCADLGLCYPPEMRTFQIGNSPRYRLRNRKRP